MMRNIYTYFFMVMFCVLGACSKQTSSITQHAFYYWENSFELTENDTTYLSQLQVKKLYIHFFDVAFNEAPTPEGKIYFSSKIPASLQVVPVVFITNETINKLDSIGILDLSKKISSRVKREIARTQIEQQVNEVQLDCDWTKTTRDRYFYLLNCIKKQFSYSLSATIRLHQYKYNQNNVPPVDKGMLMCYNINDPTQFEVDNSLFDKAEVMKYIDNVNYPLPLDLAMPTFSWGVRFTPDKKFDGLVNSLRISDLKLDTNFSSTQRKNVFVAKRQVSLPLFYFNAGDIIRVEESNTDDVKEIVSLLKSKLNQPNATLTLFHYDRILKQHENKADIEQVFNAAR